MSTVATTTNKTSKVPTATPDLVAPTNPADEIFQFNQAAVRKTLSMVIHHMLTNLAVENFFGVKFTPEINNYFKEQITERATRILGDRSPEAAATPEGILKLALELSPNSGTAATNRSETANMRQEFLKTLRSLNTVAEVEAHEGTWPEMPGTVADAVALRKSIAKRKMDRAAAKATKEAANAAKPTRTTKAPAPAPSAIADVAPKTKRPVVATID